jgi:hypothetical protein
MLYGTATIRVSHPDDENRAGIRVPHPDKNRAGIRVPHPDDENRAGMRVPHPDEDRAEIRTIIVPNHITNHIDHTHTIIHFVRTDVNKGDVGTVPVAAVAGSKPVHFVIPYH